MPHIVQLIFHVVPRGIPAHKETKACGIYIDRHILLGKHFSLFPDQEQLFARLLSQCVRSFSGELCGDTFYIPVFVLQIAGIYTGQGHYRFGIVFVPSHSSTFEAFGQTATKRFRRPGTYVIALLKKRGIIRH